MEAKFINRSMALLIAVGCFGIAAVYADELPPIDGVLGLQTESAAGWLAVSLDIPEGYALDGILWYNNDGTLQFPTVSVGTGYESGPGWITEMMTVAEQVSGVSSGWSELSFPQPIGASQGALYLAFAFPESAPFEGEGEGGGPALGYCMGQVGTPGWVSGDGEFWMKLSTDSGFALLPQLVELEDGMIVKSLDGATNGHDIPVVEPYLRAGPNPFNPFTEIRFGLTRRGDAVVDIYNLRGAKVARILDETLAAGHHTVRWTGVDGKGRGVASGPYFARLVSGDITLTQRLMLIK